MKCVAKNGEVRRVHDHEALVLVEEKGWTHIPKSEYKDCVEYLRQQREDDK